LKPAWFVEAQEVASEIENGCTTVVGYPLPNKRVLLWILRNDRPFYEQLQAERLAFLTVRPSLLPMITSLPPRAINSSNPKLPNTWVAEAEGVFIA
jgi:hypothetical protein